jgi:hypothetical protein
MILHIESPNDHAEYDLTKEEDLEELAYSTSFMGIIGYHFGEEDFKTVLKWFLDSTARTGQSHKAYLEFTSKDKETDYKTTEEVVGQFLKHHRLNT